MRILEPRLVLWKKSPVDRLFSSNWPKCDATSASTGGQEFKKEKRKKERKNRQTDRQTEGYRCRQEERKMEERKEEK